jgi:ADP-heptose:LPS heptosyltransferase
MLLVRRPRVMAAAEVLEARRAALVDDVQAGRIERILALRFARLGDVVFTTPALRVLADALPDARIDYCTSRPCAPLVAHHPTASEVLTFDPGPHHPTYLLRRRGLGREIARRRYDLAVIFESDHPTRYMLEHLCRTAGVRHVVSRSSYVGERLSKGGTRHSCEQHMKLLSMLGLAPGERSYELFYSAADAGAAARFLSAQQVSPPFDADSDGRPRHPRLVGFQPGCHYSRWPGARMLLGLRHKFHKTWSEERWTELGRLVCSRLRARVVLMGAGYERRIAERIAGGIHAPRGLEPIVAAGSTSVGMLAALLDRMDLVFSVDTGTMHMAAALGVPTVALFGPTDHEHHGPYRRAESTFVLRSGAECSPCFKRRRKQCKENVCMTEIRAEQAFEAGVALLERIEMERAAPASEGQ